MKKILLVSLTLVALLAIALPSLADSPVKIVVRTPPIMVAPLWPLVVAPPHAPVVVSRPLYPRCPPGSRWAPRQGRCVAPCPPGYHWAPRAGCCLPHR